MTMMMAAANHRCAKRSKRWLASLLLVTGVSVFCAPVAMESAARAEPVSVETRALYNRLEKLERDLIDVQRQTYQAGGAGGSAGSVSPGAGFGPDPASTADLSLRLQAAEEALRVLNGRVEELSYNLAQTQGRLKQFSEDVEFRFQELGSAGGRTLVGEGGVNQPPLVRPNTETASAAASTVGTLGTVPLGALPRQSETGSNQQPETNSGFGQPAATDYSSAVYPPAGGAAQETGPEDAYQAAINQLKRGQFDVAEADLANFLQRYPTHNLAGNAQYWLGETFYVRGAYRQAAEAFLTGYTTYASSSKAPDSLLKLGMTLAALGQQEQACATLGELTRRFPSASQAVSQRAQLERTRAGC